MENENNNAMSYERVYQVVLAADTAWLAALTYVVVTNNWEHKERLDKLEESNKVYRKQLSDMKKNHEAYKKDQLNTFMECGQRLEDLEKENDLEELRDKVDNITTILESLPDDYGIDTTIPKKPNKAMRLKAKLSFKNNHRDDKRAKVSKQASSKSSRGRGHKHHRNIDTSESGEESEPSQSASGEDLSSSSDVANDMYASLSRPDIKVGRHVSTRLSSKPKNKKK